MTKRLTGRWTLLQTLLFGTGVLAALAFLVSTVSDVGQLLEMESPTLLWALSGVLFTLAVFATAHAVFAGAHRWSGITALVLLVASSTVVGWSVRRDFFEPIATARNPPAPSTTSSPSPSPGTAVKIIAPDNGAQVERCAVEVRFTGDPTPGRVFVAATKQANSPYYFETNVERHASSGQWRTSVQAGTAKLSEDERYSIQIYELDVEWAAYLGTVVREDTAPAESWWTTEKLPPDTGEQLAGADITRTKPDPSCPS